MNKTKRAWETWWEWLGGLWSRVGGFLVEQLGGVVGGGFLVPQDEIPLSSWSATGGGSSSSICWGHQRSMSIWFRVPCSINVNPISTPCQRPFIAVWINYYCCGWMTRGLNLVAELSWSVKKGLLIHYLFKASGLYYYRIKIEFHVSFLYNRWTTAVYAATAVVSNKVSEYHWDLFKH